MDYFSHFIGIDWSGAKGNRLKGLAVAVCEVSTRTVRLVKPMGPVETWSRPEILAALVGRFGLSDQASILVGIDSSFSLPWLEEGVYIPGLDDVAGARTLWQFVDTLCDGDAHMYGGTFVERYKRYFLTPRGRGDGFKPRLRVTEQACNQMGLGRAETAFHLVGPSQVGMAALSTMRLLNRLRQQSGYAVWPFTSRAGCPDVILETFATLYTARAGFTGKVRDQKTLDSLLAFYDACYEGPAVRNDHECDAVMMAAGLMALAPEKKYWYPAALGDEIKHSEGWTFGVI